MGLNNLYPILSIFTCVNFIVKIACERLLTLFILVAAVALKQEVQTKIRQPLDKDFNILSTTARERKNCIHFHDKSELSKDYKPEPVPLLHENFN